MLACGINIDTPLLKSLFHRSKAQKITPPTRDPKPTFKRSSTVKKINLADITPNGYETHAEPYSDLSYTHGYSTDLQPSLRRSSFVSTYTIDIDAKIPRSFEI